MFDVQTISVLTLPSVPFADRKGLPACPAIYFVLSGEGTVLYIGGSVNPAGRWGAHHRVAKLTDEGATRIAWLVIDDVKLLTGLEAACIAHFAPVYNTSAGGYPRDPHTLGEALVSITARFPTSLAAQIDDHLAAMRRTIPGITLGRSDALRSLVLHALEALYGPSAGGAPDIITDTSTRRLLQKEKRRAREGGSVTDTVTDTSPLRLQLQEELRALRAGTATEESVSDTSLILSMLQQEIRTLSASAAALTVHTEGLIAATHTVEQGTGTVALETSRVTDTVADTESVTDTAAPQKPSRRRKRQQVSA